LRIDALLSARVDGLTRSQAARLIEERRVLADGGPVKKNLRITGEREIILQIPPPRPLEAPPADIPLDIVYEDGDLLVINKPRGMVVHPAPGHYDDTLVNALVARLGGRLSGIGGVSRPGIVHRLDKDTSGLVLVAKNDRAHLSLSSQLKAHTIERIYEAVVIGRVKQSGFTIDAPLARSPRDRKKMAVAEGGRCAVTRVTVIAEYAGYTHVECRLETGRTHQIRVHMAHIGHPVAGDAVYGPKKQALALKGQCLHARTVGFEHPSTGQRLTFTSSLPDYFVKVLDSLKG